MNGGGDFDRATMRRHRLAALSVEIPLFLCSYAPLFVILAIRFRTPWVEAACGAIAILGCIGGWLVLSRFRTITRATRTFVTVEDRGAEVAGYLGTYLLPFVTVPDPDWRDLVAYSLFLLLVGVIYIRSNLIQINPTLYLVGWRLYAVDGGSGWHGFVLSKGPMANGENIAAVRMTERLFIRYR